jgi:hypothetical protein
MASGISLLLFKGEQGYDISQLVETVKWKGRKGTASRSITVTLIDDDGYKHARSEIDVEEGHQCIFSYKGEELFRGIIMSQSQSNKKRMQFTAYDNGIYLSNNKDTFCYENKTASDVFSDCCTRFGLPVGEVAKCSYKIPELTKSKTTAWDAIADALSLDFDATGIRHFVSSSKGKLSLLTRRENILQWVIEVGQNLSTYTYSRSIEKIKTRVKMVSKEGTTIAEKSKAELEQKIGIFQEVDKPDESLTTAQVNDLINSILDEKSTPERTLSVDAVGIPEVISGIGVFIVIPELGLSRTFYVDEDTHTFKDNSHTMQLKLNYASDIGKEDKPDESEPEKKDYKKGDVVQFKGGSHYVSSTASKPASTGLSPGPAKITYTNPGSAHPWCLVTEDWATTHVWGWVDDGTFE